ncbi:MAG: DUF262 domain-containing protein [Hyphomonadaceae bacterium]
MKRADIVNVRGLLGGRARYRCGPARPGFYWEPQQVAQLVVDLENAARDSQDEEDVAVNRLYLGVITISPSKSGHSIVLDGQQRLAVLAMFLAFARDRMASNRERNQIDRLLVRRAFGRPPEARLRLSPEDHAWFSHFILPPGATRRLPETSPLGSPRELLLCARFMEHTFAQYDAAELSSVVDFLLHHTAVCRSLGEVRQTFTTHTQIAAPAPAMPDPFMPTPPRNTWNDQDFVPAARYRVAAE